ncbi:MAG: helix-turn-helix domain-containing protein [Pyrobaculum sp.]
MERLSKLLATVGLTARDVEIYLTLVEKGSLTARELADALHIPYTKIYAHLEKLEDLGLISADRQQRPAKFKARPPSEVYKHLVSATSQILREVKPYFDSLQLVYESRYSEALPTFLTLIKGTDRVAELIQEVVETADSEAYLAIPFEELVTYKLLAALVEESKRITIRVLTTQSLRQKLGLPPRVEVRSVSAEMFGGGAIGGAVLIYVKYGGELSGIYSNERYIADIARTYFNHLWQRAT